MYANTTPDTHGIPTPLDAFPRLGGVSFGVRLNGWDDRDGDQRVSWPSECANLGTGPDGRPMGRGGLQMAERALSGDTGSVAGLGGAAVVVTDREHDCVPEIAAAHLPSTLAGSVTFSLVPWSRAQEGRVFRNGAWTAL